VVFSSNQVTWFENDMSVTGGVRVGSTINGLAQNFAASPTPGITLNSAASAVPEPASALLFGCGILGLIAMRSRRRS
jgi:hypothetical protein